MDFDNILNIASQNQGLNNVKHKRYSLQTGPPKKVDRVKGVNSAAVQAFLKKKSLEERKKEMHLKKKKEELLAKRVELKSDRKARAMASRTKDNFRGYNGVPVVEEPKKRRSKAERDEDARTGGSYNHGNNNNDYDDEDNYKYEQTDSEPEPEPEPQRHVAKGRAGGGGAGGGVRTPGKAAAATSSRQPAALNFADLLKLAEKKQHEPVELKARPARPEERLRTAEELRELEMERWAKRPDKGRDPRPDRERDRDRERERDRDRERDQESRPQSGPAVSRKPPSLQKEQRGGRAGASGGSERKKPPTPAPAAVGAVRAQGSTRPPAGERERAKPPHGDRDRPRASAGTSGAATGGKTPSRGTTTSSSSSQGSARQAGPRPPSGPRPSTASTLSSRKAIPASAQGRPGQGGSLRGGASAGGVGADAGKLRRPCDPHRSGSNPAGPGRGGPPRPTSRGSPLPNPRPGTQPNIPQGCPINGARPPGSGAGRPGNAGLMPERRPAGNMDSGPGRPKCTVVAETISSKNMVGAPRPGMQPRPGMPARPQGMQPRSGMPSRPQGMHQRPGMPARPQGMQQRPGMPPRPPVPNLPPITSAYKNQYEEEEEYDSEMEDFIDDGGEDQDEISKHIKEIFGYDRKKYKEESEYALRFMESSWKDMQKEEARSLRLAVQEDLEEEKREEDEFKKKSAKRQKVK